MRVALDAFCLQLPLHPRARLRHWLAVFAFLVFLGLCALTFFQVVLPLLDGRGGVRLGADSDTYFAVAEAIRSGSGSGVALISLTGNFIGPVLLALLLKTGLAIALFNLALLLLAIYAAGTIPGVNRFLFTVLLILNAETLVSVVTLNKEIFALFSVALFGAYLYSERKSKLLLLVILVFAVMARWQQCAIVLLCLFLRWKPLGLGGRSRTALALVILTITVAYPIAFSNLDLNELTVQGETGGTVTKLNALQAHFLFPLVIAPKSFLNLAGQLATPSYYFGAYGGLDPSDWQNRYFIQLHTVAVMLLLLFAFARSRLHVTEPMIFFCALYLTVTALTPFVQPRYQYPVYVLLSLEISRKLPARFISLRFQPARLPALLRLQGGSPG